MEALKAVLRRRKHKRIRTARKAADSGVNDEESSMASGDGHSRDEGGAESIATIVHRVGLEAGRTEAELTAICDLLHANWIDDMTAWNATSRQNAPFIERNVPAFLRVYLDHYKIVSTQKEEQPDNAASAGGDSKAKSDEDSDTLDAEDKEQLRIVSTMADWLAKGEKHKLIVKVFVNKISEINSADSSLYFDIGIQLWFYQAEMVGADEGAPDADVVWKPTIEFMDSIEVEEVVCPESGGSFYIREKYREHGIVNWYQRYRGRINIQLDLRQFPFDTQRVSLRFGSTLYGAEDLTLVDRTEDDVKALFASRVNAPEWMLLTPLTIAEELIFNEEDKRDISYVSINFTIKRHAMYYVQNVFGAILFLDICAWWTFFIPALTLNDRLSIIITCFLALVAFNFVVAESIPKVSHSTYLSAYFLINYAVFAFAATESAVSFMLTSFLVGNTTSSLPNGIADGGPYIAQLLDWTALGIVVVVQLVLFLAYTFWGLSSDYASRAVAPAQPAQNQPNLPRKTTDDNDDEGDDVRGAKTAALLPAAAASKDDKADVVVDL